MIDQQKMYKLNENKKGYLIYFLIKYLFIEMPTMFCTPIFYLIFTWLINIGATAIQLWNSLLGLFLLCQKICITSQSYLMVHALLGFPCAQLAWITKLVFEFAN